MNCILCLKIPNKSIAIFGDHGVRLGIKSIVNKHFWFQLNEEDVDFNLICSSCWKSLQSFHKFYKEIEKAHRLFAKVNHAKENNTDGGGESKDYPMDCNDEILYQEIKIEEFNDESINKLQLGNDETVVALDENDKTSIDFDAKCDEIDFLADEMEQEDSDSEIPLSKLTAQLLDNEKEILKSTSSPDPVDKSKINQDGKVHIHEGKWLATCFGEETVTKPISHFELDKFIKLNTQLTCEMCRIPMEDFADLQAHFKDTHAVKPFVTCCDKKFELRCRLVDHILLHKLPNYFTCVVCSKVLSCRLNLRKHMDVHDKKQAFQCDKCDKTFLRKEVFNRHVLDIHTLDRKFKCEECNKLFASKCSLNTHIYGVHKGRYKKICEQCGKVSCDQETFLRHQMKHSNQPQQYFQCPKCTVKLSTKHGLRHHLRYQHSEDTREHVCNVCGTIATNEAALKRHITFMHKYKRDFKCTLCEKGFKRAVTLKPNADMSNAKYICCSCWSTVESFHNFYTSIEEAHTQLSTCLTHPDKDDESTHFDSFSELFTTVVKEETSDDTNKVELPDTPETVQPPTDVVTKHEEEKEGLNSDSESEVTNLNCSLRDDTFDDNKSNESDSEDSFSVHNNDNPQEDEDFDSDSDYKAPKKKAKAKIPSNKNSNKFGKHTIPCKEFDSFIKKNIKLSCSLCTKPMENFFSLKGHFKKVHKKDPFVTCCDKQWTSRFSLVHHLLLHQDPDLYKCKKCSRVLANKRSYNHHMQSHITQERVHPCTKCKKMFSSIPKLEKHLKSHIRKHIDQICEQCGKVCHSKQSLSAHQKREHMGFVKQRVQCTKCGAYLADSSTLHFHMKYQHPKTEVVNVCTICGKISATAYGLKRHIQYMHTMERVHKCTICEDKAFKTAQILRPNAKLENSKFVCCSCWDTVHSFHTFYKSIEEAHTVFTACLKLPDEESDNESTHFNDKFSHLVTTVVKKEKSEEPELESPEIPEITLTQPIDVVVKIDKEKEIPSSESESEELLVKLSPHRNFIKKDKCEESSGNESDSDGASFNPVPENEEGQQENDTTDSGSDYAAPKKKKKKVKVTSDVNELRKKGMPQKEFDSFIKEKMDLVCDICSKSLQNFFCLQQHFKKAHKADGYVKCCEKQWFSRFSLVHHLILHQNPDLFKCSICGRVLANKRSFNYHMKKVHTDVGEPIHECKKCKKLFTSIPKLEKHFKSHTRKRDDGDQICDQCGKVYHSKQVLKVHQRRDHLGLIKPKERVQCTICGVYLSDISTLKFHTTHLHPKDKVVHSCDTCGWISATGYGLKRHIQYMHTMERVHKCTICEGKAFKTAQRLRLFCGTEIHPTPPLDTLTAFGYPYRSQAWFVECENTSRTLPDSSYLKINSCVTKRASCDV